MPPGGSELFIVGPARSGTTFLLTVINASPDIFLFSELNGFALCRKPDFYAGYGGTNFSEHFNSRKIAEGGIRQKGAFIPNAKEISSVPDLFRSLTNHYRIVGEKIALLDDSINGLGFQEVLIEEHLLNHFHSWHFLLFREPIATLISSKLLFPNKSHAHLLRCLIFTYDSLLLMLAMFPRSVAFVYEQLATVNFDEVFEMLEVRRPFCRLPTFKEPSAARPDITEAFGEMAEQVERVVSIYDRIPNAIAPKCRGLGFDILPDGYQEIRARETLNN